MKSPGKAIAVFFVLAVLFVLCGSIGFHYYQGRRVTSLIEQLASPVPPKYTNQETEVVESEYVNGYIHPQVANARSNLVAMGTSIYPELVKHRDDSRYSYSTDEPAWWNVTVGGMVRDIMADGIEFHAYAYKVRKNPKGGNRKPNFDEMLEETGFEKYAEHAKSHTKADLESEYIEWYMKKERSYGFINPQQEANILEPYIKKSWELAPPPR